MVTNDKDVNVYYNEYGKEQKDEDKALARKTEKSFYIMEFYGKLFKKGTVVKKTDQSHIKWRKVGPECFKNYLSYLQTNREPRYLMAERNHLD